MQPERFQIGMQSEPMALSLSSFLRQWWMINCSVRWPTQGGKPPTAKELCGQADFGETKLCGGTRNSTTWRLPMAKVR